MTTSPSSVSEQVVATSVHFADDKLHVTLSDGRVIIVPYHSFDWLQWLSQASPEQRQNWSLEPGGFAIYWDDLDDGIEIAHLLTLRPLA